MLLLSVWLKILLVEEERRRLHSFNSLGHLVLHFLLMRTCPVSEERIHQTNNLSRRFDSFVFKARWISCAPNSPTDRRQTNSMHIQRLRENPLNPQPVQVYVNRSTNRPQRVSKTPHIFGCWTLEKQMGPALSFITESTRCIALPLTFTQLSLVKIELCETSHKKILIFNGILAFHTLLELGP
jgi:hypothetical protein